MTKNVITHSHNKKNSSFSKPVASQRAERVAHEALHDVSLFQEALEKELAQMEESRMSGHSIDTDLQRKMLQAKELYYKVISSFTHEDDITQHHRLIAYSDAIKDVITHIHHRSQN